MPRGRARRDDGDQNQDNTYVDKNTLQQRPRSAEEAARPQNPDYVPRYEDGTEKPFERWSVLEQEMYQANHASPQAIRAHTDHLGPSARVGLDPRGPIMLPENAPDNAEIPGSLDPNVPTGKPGQEKMEEQDETGDQKVVEAKQM
jgi:hypothetical protein